jgi:signal transduction histidine kinase
MADQVPVEFETYYSPKDAWYYIKAYPAKDGGLSVFFQDITLRRRSEELLRKSHEDLEKRVYDRTLELFRTTRRLGQQIARRMRLEAARTDLLRRLVHAQEEEHRRIARELHDDLTQRLAVLAIEAGTLEHAPDCPPGFEQKARAMHRQLVELSDNVHSLSRQLHPAILDDLGLVDALRSECLSLRQRDGVAVKYIARNIPTNLPREIALCVYRVAQAALRNVVRHAQSTRSTMRLDAAANELTLCIRDYGVGFDRIGPGKTGVGLASMRERARLIRARLSVRSRLGKGTKVTLTIPLNRSSPSCGRE